MHNTGTYEKTQHHCERDAVWQEIMSSFHTQAQDLVEFKRNIYALCTEHHDRLYALKHYPKSSSADSYSTTTSSDWRELENAISTFKRKYRDDIHALEKEAGTV